MPTICVTPIDMHNGRDKSSNLQINGSINCISNTHEGVMQNKIYYN